MGLQVDKLPKQNYFPIVRRACCTSGSLYGGATGFNPRVVTFLWIHSVYINDVALAAGISLIHLYADDTILYTSGPSLDTVITNLQTSFNAIQLPFRGLQLLLSASKTKCMPFNRSLPAPARPSSITTLHSSDLEYVDNYILYLFSSFAPQYPYLHIHLLHIYHSSV